MVELRRAFDVREARESDIAGAIEALVEGFADDPVMSKALGGRGKTQKIKDLFRFQIESIYRPHGKVDVAVGTQGIVLGAALWLGPEAQKGNLLAEIRSLPGYFKVLGSSLPQAALTELQLLTARPKFAHWYLYTIGVQAHARGRGVGAALLDFRRHQMGKYPAYLEASTYRSAALYRRHGFVELGPYKRDKPAIGMWHPAPESNIDRALQK